MMPTKSLIYALQDHFTARARIIEAMTAIKCYTKGASFFYSCKDGWDNKKYFNLTLDPEDVLPLLQKKIDSIDKDIVYSSIGAEIDSEENLNECIQECIQECRQKGLSFSAGVESIKSKLKKAYAHRVIVDETAEDNIGDNNYQDKPYHIEISNGKSFEFWLVGRCKNTLMFGFNGIVDNDTDRPTPAE